MLRPPLDGEVCPRRQHDVCLRGVGDISQYLELSLPQTLGKNSSSHQNPVSEDSLLRDNSHMSLLTKELELHRYQEVRGDQGGVEGGGQGCTVLGIISTRTKLEDGLIL